jgi:hypothetical protein
MRFGTWNVRILCRAGSLKTVVRELGNYKLDLVGVQEDGRRRVLKEQRIIRFSIKIISYRQVFSYIRESYQQLEE